MSQRRPRLIARTISSPAFDIKFAQSACWLVAGLILVFLILVLGMYKVTELSLTETELFFGLLLVLNLSMLSVVLGMVLPLAIRTEHNHNERL